jgi:hypothetical protein
MAIKPLRFFLLVQPEKENESRRRSTSGFVSRHANALQQLVAARQASSQSQYP